MYHLWLYVRILEVLFRVEVFYLLILQKKTDINLFAKQKCQIYALTRVSAASTRQDADLALPRARTEAGRRRLFFSIVQFYNRLPPETRALPLGSFKREVLQLLDKWNAWVKCVVACFCSFILGYLVFVFFLFLSDLIVRECECDFIVALFSFLLVYYIFCLLFLCDFTVCEWLAFLTCLTC